MTAGQDIAAQDRALDALTLAWGSQYDEFSVYDGEWGAPRNDAGDDDIITAATPEELNRAIREREGTP